MQCRITDLRCKEIINICDGKRIGYAEDVDLVPVSYTHLDVYKRQPNI